MPLPRELEGLVGDISVLLVPEDLQGVLDDLCLAPARKDRPAQPFELVSHPRLTKPSVGLQEGHDLCHQ
eukprot:8879763-Alexandrium_andersonii.AAC.1